MRILPLFFLLVATAHAELPVAELKRDTPVDFATEVYPFLKANCLACHNSTKAKADLILETPADMIKGGETAPAVEPGNGENSFLFTTAAHIEEPTMPPKNNKSKAKNLTPEQLALLKLWIDQGAEGGAVATPAPESWSLLTGPQPILTSAITEDGRFAAVGRGQRIDLYDLRLGKLETSLRDPSIQLPTAHNDAVQSLAFSPDGILASGGYRSVKIWKRKGATSGEPVDLPDEPTSMKTSPDSKTTAVGTKNGSIVLVVEGKVQTAKTHSAAVHDLAFSADGKLLFSVSADKTVQRRDVSALDKATTLKLPAEALSLALINQGKQVALGGSDHTIRICQADLKSPFPLPPTPKPTPAPAEKEPETKPAPAMPQLKADTPKPAPKEAPKKEAEAAKPAPKAEKDVAKETPTPPATPKKPEPSPPAKPPAPKPKTIATFKFHAHPIVALEPANAEGTEFLAAHADGTVIHCKIDPAKPDATPSQVRRVTQGGALASLAVSLDFTKFATSVPTASTYLWKMADGSQIAELKRDPIAAFEIAELTRAKSVADRIKTHWDKKAPEAETLWKAEVEKVEQAAETIAKAKRDLVAKRSALEAMEEKNPAATEEELEKAREEFAEVERTLNGAIRNRESSARLAGEAFGREAAAKSSAKEAEALSKAIAEESTALQNARNDAAIKDETTGIAFSRDGSTLIQSKKDSGVRLWSASNGIWLEDVPDVASAIAVDANSADRFSIVTSDKKLVPWKLPSGDWSLAKSLGDGKAPEPFEDRVGALEFGPRGAVLAAGTGVPSRSGTIVVWDTKTWEEIARNEEAHDDTITSFTFSPGGDQLASGSTDTLIKIFETETLANLQTLEGHTGHVLDIDWNADDLVLASASADKQVKVWDLTEGVEASKTEGFEKEVSSVEYIDDSTILLTASGDETVKFGNDKLPGAKSFLHSAASSSDGMVLIAGGDDGVLRVWDRVGRKLVNEFPQPDTTDRKVAAE